MSLPSALLPYLPPDVVPLYKRGTRVRAVLDSAWERASRTLVTYLENATVWVNPRPFEHEVEFADLPFITVHSGKKSSRYTVRLGTEETTYSGYTALVHGVPHLISRARGEVPFAQERGLAMAALSFLEYENTRLTEAAALQVQADLRGFVERVDQASTLDPLAMPSASDREIKMPGDPSPLATIYVEGAPPAHLFGWAFVFDPPLGEAPRGLPVFYVLLSVPARPGKPQDAILAVYTTMPEHGYPFQAVPVVGDGNTFQVAFLDGWVPFQLRLDTNGTLIKALVPYPRAQVERYYATHLPDYLVRGAQGDFPPPPATVVQRDRAARRQAPLRDLLDDYVARGLEVSAAFNELVRDRDLRPDVSMPQFRAMYEDATPRKLPIRETVIPFHATHFDRLTGQFLQATPKPGGRTLTLVWESGMTGEQATLDAPRFEPAAVMTGVGVVSTAPGAPGGPDAVEAFSQAVDTLTDYPEGLRAILTASLAKVGAP